MMLIRLPKLANNSRFNWETYKKKTLKLLFPLQPISHHQWSARPLSSSRFLFMSQCNHSWSHTVYLQSPMNHTLPLVGIYMYLEIVINYSCDLTRIPKHCFLMSLSFQDLLEHLPRYRCDSCCHWWINCPLCQPTGQPQTL